MLASKGSKLSMKSKKLLLVGKRSYIKPAYDLAKKIMPKISNTEAAALNAGTVGFDGDIFTGNPSLKNLVNKYSIKLSTDENNFMNNQVNKLCTLLNDYDIARSRDLSPEVW